MILFIFIIIFIFSILYLPFINSIPYMDGSIDLIRSSDFYHGGFNLYFHNWGSVHPPLKLFITNILFYLFGINTYSYNIIGFVFGILGIIFIYKLCENLFDKKTAFTSSLLLATSPIFLAVGIFGLTDYLTSILILISLNFYSKKNYLFYSLLCSLAVLTKETGLLLPITVFLIDSMYSLKQRHKILKKINLLISRLVYLFLPFITYYCWTLFMDMNGQTAWNDWNFSTTANKGSVYTIINNIFTFSFLNKYAYQNWAQLFLLNFNWIMWGIFSIGFTIYIFKNFIKIKNNLLLGNQTTKTILILIIFPVLYIFTVLSFQTYTIPRYATPILTLLPIGISWSIVNFIYKSNLGLKLLFSILFFFIILLRLFYSVDPISLKLWGKTNILGENFYALNEYLAGNDGITYNMEYLFLAKKRSDQIFSAKNHVLSNQCSWIFPDPNNDYKTIKVLNLRKLDIVNPCISK